MNTELIQSWGKKIFKSVATTLALTLLVTVAAHVVTNLYDQRIVMGVIAGKLGFDALYGALGKIKGLE